MNKKKTTYSIRGKLISAACMLLVAVIMVVSSTYAWFTLSTAPEVTGIHTAIGANGALEMALNNGEAIQNSPVADGDDANTYWGNLVNLSGNTYGLNQITLLPSQFITTDGTFTNAGFLATPTYGADGRVKGLEQNTTLGTYDAGAGSFLPSSDLGVRGVGTASGMTDRELAYSNAKGNALTYAGLAKAGAAGSLNAYVGSYEKAPTNGSVLANVAIQHGTGEDAAGYTAEDVQAMHNIFNSLLGTDAAKADGVLEYIEQAYMQYILMYSASTAVGEGEAWSAVKALVNAEGATLEGVLNNLATAGVTLDAATLAPMNALIATKTTVATAQTKLPAVVDGKTDYAWGDFSGALGALLNADMLRVNDWTVDEIKTNQDEFAKSAMNGLTVTMGSGSGVYADIADHCGDYTASVSLNINYQGLNLTDIPATMKTATAQKPTYLDAVKAAMPAVYVGADTSTKPLTEFYGYIIDLAFRTNAANSNLLLQTTPVDRIYDDNNNVDTQGGGSTMTFATASTSFTTQQMKDLMENIKIVFFTPGETNTILAYAALDAQNATAATSGNGLTANIYLLDTDGTTMITDTAEADIISLTQNVQHNVSVLVYLDGTTLENADVAADAAASMTGTMNLQFSSSANLVPMEYADLHTPGETTAASSDAAGN